MKLTGLRTSFTGFFDTPPVAAAQNDASGKAARALRQAQGDVIRSKTPFPLRGTSPIRGSEWKGREGGCGDPPPYPLPWEGVRMAPPWEADTASFRAKRRIPRRKVQTSFTGFFDTPPMAAAQNDASEKAARALRQAQGDVIRSKTPFPLWGPSPKRGGENKVGNKKNRAGSEICPVKNVKHLDSGPLKTARIISSSCQTTP